MDDKPHACDNLYLMREFSWKRWSLEEAIEELRLQYHPSMGNKPNALVEAKIELDLRATKKERYIDEFTKMVPIMNAYDRGIPDRSVLAFVSNEDQAKLATEAGALRAGGEDLVSDIAKGRSDIVRII